MKKFIDQLMKKMTFEEKIGQLSQIAAGAAITGTAKEEAEFITDLKKGRVGSFMNVSGTERTRELQKIAVENTRLKIPLIFGYDVIHGHKTIFPISLAMSCSWDLEAIERSSRIGSTEAAADGVHWVFAPAVDISRDPRWGRVFEGVGEDPWWGSKVAIAQVKGIQGKAPDSVDTTLACVKHFAAYGAPTAGREYAAVNVSKRSLLETYLPTYKAAIEAGAATVMTAFNDVDGIPATGNKWLFTDVLRRQWKFKGFVVSDFTAVRELIKHGVAANEAEAANLALNAGVDMEMIGGTYLNNLKKLIKDKKVKMATVNTSVRRVLEAKYRLGLFKDPYRYNDTKRAQTLFLSESHRAAARDVARRSMVLLKNENQVLPLKRGSTIALIGPLVDDRRNIMGNWSLQGDSRDTVSVGEGMKTLAGKNTKILMAKGANLLNDEELLVKMNRDGDEIQVDTRSAEEMLKEAVDVAKKADVVVVTLGESAHMSGEAASRTSLRIPEHQQRLLKALKETGKPVVAVLFNGRPLCLEFENAVADALLEAWWPGTEAGHALADVLFGDYNPSGHLVSTFPRNEGQIPIFYEELPTGRPLNHEDKYTSKYIDCSNEPLFPFGFGLSYTKFAYGEIKLSSKTLKWNKKLSVSIPVSNVGKYDGEEVVQLYIRDLVASVSRPVKQLRGAEKIFLKKGETKTVKFELALNDLSFYNKDYKWVAEPGEFQVFVGTNCQDVKQATFQLER